MRTTDVLNYSLYQVGWLACAIGSARFHPWAGTSLAVVLTAIHLVLARDRAGEVRLIIIATVLGGAAETLQLRAGTYTFTSGSLLPNVAPLWLLAMWAQFATTFRYSLRWLTARPGVAAFFGALGGPAAFLVGERIGALTFVPPAGAGLVRLAVAWAVVMLALALITSRVPSAQSASATYRGFRAPRRVGGRLGSTAARR